MISSMQTKIRIHCLVCKSNYIHLASNLKHFKRKHPTDRKNRPMIIKDLNILDNGGCFIPCSVWFGCLKVYPMFGSRIFYVLVLMLLMRGYLVKYYIAAHQILNSCPWRHHYIRNRKSSIKPLSKLLTFILSSAVINLVQSNCDTN